MSNFLFNVIVAACLILLGMELEVVSNNYRENIVAGNTFRLGKQFYKCNKVK